MIVIPFKRGDTFLLRCTYSNDDAAVFPTAIASQLRDRTGAVIAELTAQHVDAASRTYQLRALGDTSEWPIGLLTGDIRYQYATGDTWHTEENYQVNVREAVTRD